MRASWSVALAPVVFERCLRRVDRGGGLRDLRAIVVVRQQHQLVSLTNLLVVIHLHFANESDHLRAQRRQIPPDVGIVGHLLDASALPSVPVARDRERDRQRHQHDEQRRAESPPGGLQRTDRVFNLRARCRDDRPCGHFERPPYQLPPFKGKDRSRSRATKARGECIAGRRSDVSFESSVQASTHLETVSVVAIVLCARKRLMRARL